MGRLIVEFAFGDVYARPGLSLRDRELITVAMLAAMGAREPQLDVHLAGACNVGISIEELREVMIHVAPYAGSGRDQRDAPPAGVRVRGMSDDRSRPQATSAHALSSSGPDGATDGWIEVNVAATVAP